MVLSTTVALRGETSLLRRVEALDGVCVVYGRNIFPNRLLNSVTGRVGKLRLKSYVNKAKIIWFIASLKKRQIYNINRKG